MKQQMTSSVVLSPGASRFEGGSQQKLMAQHSSGGFALVCVCVCVGCPAYGRRRGRSGRWQGHVAGAGSRGVHRTGGVIKYFATQNGFTSGSRHMYVSSLTMTHG